MLPPLDSECPESSQIISTPGITTALISAAAMGAGEDPDRRVSLEPVEVLFPTFVMGWAALAAASLIQYVRSYT